MQEFLNGALSFILYIIPAAIIALFPENLLKFPTSFFGRSFILYFLGHIFRLFLPLKNGGWLRVLLLF